ncbi:14354_t:CDS:2 [Funneliformis caledonium]|uniref:14354_t:CDS:1 n=1 Tax=Funneliformis caledonium TaxID=1117310 RepID=A0A9N8V3C2_9GLOM|nr:14354_t:CDS:2 [Funneliformis caledonium]
MFKKRQANDEEDQLTERGSKNPRIEIVNCDDDSGMNIDTSLPSNFSPSPSLSPSNSYFNSREMNSPSYQQDDIEVSNELNKMSLDNIMDMDDCESTSELEQGYGSIALISAKGACCIAQNFEAFSPYIKIFFNLGKEIIILYEKAEHHKELCSSLLQRCNCAMATVKDLYIRKTENKWDISQLSKLRKFFFTNKIEETFQNLIAEFDGFMNSLNFTFTIQSNNNLATITNDMKQIMEKLSFYDVPNDRQSQQNFFNDVNSVAGSAQEFKRQTRKNKILDSSEVKTLDENEPLIFGNQYQQTGVYPTKKIEKLPPYDSKCEIYSVGALLWEIAELKKPHSDLNKSDVLLGIRERVNDRYCLPFSNEVPRKWKELVKDAMIYEPACRPKISEICRKLHKLSKKNHSITTQDYAGESEENLSMDYPNPLPPSFVTITILPINDAIRTHKSKNGNKQLAWQSFKYHSSTNIEAKYWLGYYYYHHGEIIPELKQIDKKERIRMSIEIFKETADKGNPSAQLRYGLCLLNGEGVDENFVEAFKYLKDSAHQGNTTAMYIIGKAYWKGGNGIEQDREQGAKYLKVAALENHPKAKEMCNKCNIPF